MTILRSDNLLFLMLAVNITATTSCSKKETGTTQPEPPVQPSSVSFSSVKVDGISNGFTYYNVNFTPVIEFAFSQPLNKNSVNSSVSFQTTAGANVNFTAALQHNDSAILIKPANALSAITQYNITVSTNLQSVAGGNLQNDLSVNLITAIDSADKFARISDDALLDLVQKQTFKYFWDFGHPTSGLARERNTSGDVCTTGGTGFGILSILAAASRNIISRTDALTRIQKITSFYKNNCTAYHGAFAHWINGATGATVPFSTQDNGADIVETSYLMQALLCARQYFNTTDAAEVNLHNDINFLWNKVEWNWFRQNNQDVLYWHWSPDYNWAINLPIHGWDEALITYVLAASSDSSAIPKTVYDNGWAQNGSIKNGSTYYGIQLQLGPPYGGPLFFSQYSFMGINPHDLTDAYAAYWTQDTAHSKINYLYCVNNPKQYNGYSNLCWGLTASDEKDGYSAHSPTNDNGTISPTAAVSSLPFTPAESVNALRFFYYTLGDKLWGDYGFRDAFNLTDVWFADSYLAIDQGPQVVMIENYRSGLLWNLFMSCPEIKKGMESLGFSSPNL